jgi:hypothetical protein
MPNPTMEIFAIQNGEKVDELTHPRVSWQEDLNGLWSYI